MWDHVWCDSGPQGVSVLLQKDTVKGWFILLYQNYAIANARFTDDPFAKSLTQTSLEMQLRFILT